jgi:ribosome-associated toxin RatA of RatAB toxin-antitoxin module
MFRRPRFTTLATTWALLILSRNAEAFYGNSRGCSSKIRVPAFRFKNHDARSVSVRNQGIEEDFQGKFVQPFVGVDAETTLSKVFRRFPNVISFDKKRFAKTGVAFALTYSIISNINGSISLSLAWYMASKQVSA